MKVMVVAGEKTSPLVKQLQDTGAVEVVDYCSSLATSFNRISNSLVKIDNLVYVYSSDMNIRADMQLLSKLLSPDFTYFSCSFVNVFYTKNEITNKGIEAFIFQMRELGFDNYEIRGSDIPLTYVEIYRSLLGVDKSSKLTNTYEQVYMIERNSSTKNVYNEDYTIESIEPFDYKNIDLYKKRVEEIERLDNPNNFSTDEKLDELPTFDNPDLGSIMRGNNALGKNIYICTGYSKTGVTSLCNTLAYACSTFDKSVLVIDLNSSMGCSKMLKLNELDFNDLYVKDLFGDSFTKINKKNLSCFSIAPSRYYKEVLSHLLLDKSYNVFDYIFIDVPLDLLSVVKEYCGSKINRIYIGCYDNETAISDLKSEIICLGDMPIYVMLCPTRSDYYGSKVLSPIEIRQYLGVNNISIVQSLPLVDIRKHIDLFNKLC